MKKIANRLQAIRGMNDLLPENLDLWQQVEAILQHTVATYGYREIRTPVVENADLFIRSIGEVTDVVEKEMYLFDDRGGDRLALRPEVTAGCARAGIERGLLYNQEQRFWSLGPMFRYERPQKGRARQFHQFGVEVFGLAGPGIDAEIIAMTVRLWRKLGIEKQLRLQINTIGSTDTRVAYRRALLDYLQQRQEQLDEESRRRLLTNPLRILDSKNAQVQEMLVGAPRFSDYLDDASRAHFTELCDLLERLQIPYQYNERLVRGLDYYNRTVFEWITDDLGAQGTLCGGGRYDGLVEQLGGHGTPAIGFSIGLERLILLMEQQSPRLNVPSPVDLYLISVGKDTLATALQLAEMIHSALPTVRLMTHCGGGNFKKQFKRADKVGAQVALVLGEQEVASQQVVVKPLRLTPSTPDNAQCVLQQSLLIPHLQRLLNQSIKQETIRG